MTDEFKPLNPREEEETNKSLELTQTELIMLEDGLAYSPYCISEIYGETWINLLNKIRKLTRK